MCSATLAVQSSKAGGEDGVRSEAVQPADASNRWHYQAKKLTGVCAVK